MTSEEHFFDLLKSLYPYWKHVREYDDEHLHYDRHSDILEMMEKGWTETPDLDEFDTDVQSLVIIIEQLLRYNGIVKNVGGELFPPMKITE
ncbi:MAG: hypothetical protein H8E71_00360 [Candidatus Marinimicrobia bacterium]|nr:hypothetical protein [Candidatus Neomarinimicrobiota bacterium]